MLLNKWSAGATLHKDCRLWCRHVRRLYVLACLLSLWQENNKTNQLESCGVFVWSCKLVDFSVSFVFPPLPQIKKLVGIVQTNSTKLAGEVFFPRLTISYHGMGDGLTYMYVLIGWGLKAKSWWINSAVAKFIAFGHTFAMKIIFSPQKRFSGP